MGDVTGTVIKLGSDAYPLGVVHAFDSIWVANHHQDDVYRLDPDTLELVSAIPIGLGPGWFAVTDDALWVSNQLGLGVSRVDPATNSAVPEIGDRPPCGDLAAAGGFVWQWACDSGSFLRIDAATNESSTFPTKGHGWLYGYDDKLFTTSEAGLAEIDPQTVTITEIGACECDRPMGDDGEAMWFVGPESSTVTRITSDGTVLGTLDLPRADKVDGADGRAWLTVPSEGVQEIEVATGEVIQTLEMLTPLGLVEFDGVIWVADRNMNELWRLAP